ncbi:MAG: hypothetical protein ASUL_08569 [Candidatus Aramenus sulfurataquae]|uniref:Uncharacterized protein n=1 Tax=Candidatus Aramenus sulfurataquae TaxID=1326980 RepID=W7KK74_9CREN|nr:MAG: hypothetical protein ASUL_08569 [Candidatus Aramenus sulfurataquae]
MKALFLLVLLGLLPTLALASTDYGYEFGYVPLNGVQSLVEVYNLSLAPGSPDVSVQQNVCINVGGQEVFVQNVLHPLPGEGCWETSIYYNGEYNYTVFWPVKGSWFNLTTVWYGRGNETVVDFYFSNGTFQEEKTYVLQGGYIGVVYDGYTIGTVVAGYANSEVAFLAEGFNVSIESFYLLNGSWYVPPVAWSGWQNTGESVVGGEAYYYDGRVWVVYGNSSSPQLLYNASVVIVNNTVYVFPMGSLWEVNGKYFTNETEFAKGEVLKPLGTNYSFVAEKEIELKFPEQVVVDGVKGEVFYLPSPETVYVREGDKCVPVYVNSNVTYSLKPSQTTPSQTTSSQTTAPSQTTSSQTTSPPPSSTGTSGATVGSVAVSGVYTSAAKGKGISWEPLLVGIAVVVAFAVLLRRR